MKHAGMGWPTGPVDLGRMFALPSDRLLMLITEGRYHGKAAKAAGKRVVLRAIPRGGNRPAELGWSPSKFVAEVLDKTDEPGCGFDEFIPWNELDLNTERGDHEDDFANMGNRYALIGGWAFSVIQQLRSRLADGCRLHFGAFTPDHHALNYVDRWRAAADACDVVDFHAYDTLDKIQLGYYGYRQAFPGKPLALTEWHGKGDAEEERRILTWLADTMAADPLFDAAYRFIWRWDYAPDWWSPSYNVEGNPAMEALFMNPPLAMPAPEPTPEPLPEPEPIPEPAPQEPPPMTREERIALVCRKADQLGIDRVEFLGGAFAESGPNLDQWERYGTWPDVSFGLFHQTVAFADEGDHRNTPENIAYIRDLYFNPEHACDVAGVKYRYWRFNPDVPALTAWCAYNMPASYHNPESNPNINNYRASLALAARTLGASEPVPAGLTYGPDVPDEVIRQKNDWSCAVRSTYAALWAMAQQGHGEPVTYGDGGPRDVYDWMVPTYDDPSVGLHAADGSGLVEVLRSHGYAADRLSPALLANVQARAGRQPVLIGGRAWNHWVYVSGVEPDGTLILENPSPGFAGISGQLRDSWDRLGPFTAVWIDLPGAAVPEMEGEVTKVEAEQLRAENKRLRDMLGYASSDIAAAIQKELDTTMPSLNALQAAVDTLKRQAA